MWLEVQRDKTDKWYVSEEAWPHKYFPTWFQGLVYFLTPRHAGLLYSAALNTPYMHTDDAFIGILVNKTSIFASGIRPITNISMYQGESYEDSVRMLSEWRHSPIIFFHIPNTQLFMEWSLEKPLCSWVSALTND